MTTLRHDIPEDVLIKQFQDQGVTIGTPQYDWCRKKVGNWLLLHINKMKTPLEASAILLNLGLVSGKTDGITRKGKAFLHSQFYDPRNA